MQQQQQMQYAPHQAQIPTPKYQESIIDQHGHYPTPKPEIQLVNYPGQKAPSVDLDQPEPTMIDDSPLLKPHQAHHQNPQIKISPFSHYNIEPNTQPRNINHGKTPFDSD